MVACTYEMSTPNSKPFINIPIYIHKCMYYKVCPVLLKQKKYIIEKDKSMENKISNAKRKIHPHGVGWVETLPFQTY